MLRHAVLKNVISTTFALGAKTFAENNLPLMTKAITGVRFVLKTTSFKNVRENGVEVVHKVIPLEMRNPSWPSDDRWVGMSYLP